ncbi:MAG: bifunctional pyr operon transcriptional regulator/uracil phosphoribosyltransferase PyrR [Chloroflexi bacterium]|nr:MAG: bifunctional pyr operon transcriptional regulator/uracil phosphoribosyltransferase PyrR [Chloroflexota bacterium]
MTERSERAATVPDTPILDSDALHRTLRRLAHEIVEATQGVEGLVLVGIESGGAVLARRLADEIEQFESHRPACGSLDITLHRDDLNQRGFAAAPRPTQLPDIDGKVVVLVDDVLFTGRSVRAAMDSLNDYGRPRAVRLAVLVDRGHRELPIRADMVGKNIPTSRTDDVRVLLQEVDGRDCVLVVPGEVAI